MISIPQNPRIITLLTDFGSFYPAQMKGAILQKTVEAEKTVLFVDVAHDVAPQNVRAGAFVLMVTSRYFPAGTIHIAVVDPGVGTARRALVIESGGHILIGPDNGLLMPAARSLGDPRAFCLNIPPGISTTFHGRDVFSPAAAAIVCGSYPASLGHMIDMEELIGLDFGVSRQVEKGIEAEVIYVDRFGNAVLNIAQSDLHGRPDELSRSIPSVFFYKGLRLRWVRTYAEAGPIEPLITLGSHGYWEIAVNGGSAADLFGLSPGDRIMLEEENCSE